MTSPSKDFEAAVLGSILIDDSVLNLIKLEPSDFADFKNQELFAAMLKIREASGRVDSLTMLGKTSWTAYDLTGLIQTVPSASNAVFYAEKVREESDKRKLWVMAKQVEAASGNGQSSAEIVETVERQITEIKRRSVAAPSMRDILYSTMDIMENGEKLIPTGFYELDKFTGGFLMGLTVIGARPGNGKTALMISLARHIALQQGIPTDIYSIEMRSERIVMRLIAGELGIDLFRIRTKKISSEEWKRIHVLEGRLDKMPLTIDHTPGMTVWDFRAKLAESKKRHGTKIAFIDYLQLMGTRSERSRYEEIGTITRNLVWAAHEEGVAIVLLSQLSRDAEERRPNLSDLRESGNIEQDADMVIFPYIEDKENSTIAELIVAKQRDGATASAEVLWQKEYARFANIDKTFESKW